LGYFFANLVTLLRYQLTVCAATSKVIRRDSEFLSPESFATRSDADSDDSALADFEASVEVLGTDKPVHTFSKLPEIVGSGFPYLVQIRVAATSAREVSKFDKHDLLTQYECMYIQGKHGYVSENTDTGY
jgi:hypothetical protein